MSHTDLEKLRIKERSFAALGEHYVGTGIWSYEKQVCFALDSPNHNSFPIQQEWLRKSIKRNWKNIVETIKEIAAADINITRGNAIVETGRFLSSVKTLG